MQTTLHVHLPGNTMKLTTGAFVRPSGKNLHRFPDSKLTDEWGIEPDHDLEFRLTRAGAAVEGLVGTAVAVPGNSNERLPLDDPTADAQRGVAIESLHAGSSRLGVDTSWRATRRSGRCSEEPARLRRAANRVVPLSPSAVSANLYPGSLRRLTDLGAPSHVDAGTAAESAHGGRRR